MPSPPAAVLPVMMITPFETVSQSPIRCCLLKAGVSHSGRTATATELHVPRSSVSSDTDCSCASLGVLQGWVVSTLESSCRSLATTAQEPSGLHHSLKYAQVSVFSQGVLAVPRLGMRFPEQRQKQKALHGSASVSFETEQISSETPKSHQE